MARIAGTDLPRSKKIEIALTAIFGIGRSRAKKILTEAKIPFEKAEFMILVYGRK